MNWKIFALENGTDDWAVEATFADGGQRIYTATFSGIGAEARAYEYLKWVGYRSSVAAVTAA